MDGTRDTVERGRDATLGRADATENSSSRNLVLVKTQTGTVYTHQEFKYEVIDTHSLLLQLPLIH